MITCYLCYIIDPHKIEQFFALNLGRKRYERCPYCWRWHWTQKQSTRGA
jgi:hypothetical protein